MVYKDKCIMKNIFFLIVSGVIFISCHTHKNLAGNKVMEKNNLTELNGTWLLQTLFATDNNWTKAPFIKIDLKDRTFTGNSSCNSMSGKFIISQSYFAFDKNIISTKMACTGNYENIFLSALLKINKYTINKDELELGQGEIVLMKFKKN